jgi:hypothetical protein
VNDESAVAATVSDYWEGWFDGDAERMRQALHPSLTKIGAVNDEPGPRITAPMTAPDMIGWTQAGEGVPDSPVGRTFDLTINDIYHEIATVTVRSGIYREYLHLVKTPAGWRILNALYRRIEGL